MTTEETPKDKCPVPNCAYNDIPEKVRLQLGSRGLCPDHEKFLDAFLFFMSRTKIQIGPQPPPHAGLVVPSPVLPRSDSLGVPTGVHGR